MGGGRAYCNERLLEAAVEHTTTNDGGSTAYYDERLVVGGGRSAYCKAATYLFEATMLIVTSFKLCFNFVAYIHKKLLYESCFTFWIKQRLPLRGVGTTER